MSSQSGDACILAGCCCVAAAAIHLLQHIDASDSVHVHRCTLVAVIWVSQRACIPACSLLLLGITWHHVVLMHDCAQPYMLSSAAVLVACRHVVQLHFTCRCNMNLPLMSCCCSNSSQCCFAVCLSTQTSQDTCAMLVCWVWSMVRRCAACSAGDAMHVVMLECIHLREPHSTHASSGAVCHAKAQCTGVALRFVSCVHTISHAGTLQALQAAPHTERRGNAAYQCGTFGHELVTL